VGIDQCKLRSLSQWGIIERRKPSIAKRLWRNPIPSSLQQEQGIIRLFANSLTGIDSGFESVVIKLSFLNESENLSGLLRHNNGLDTTLDQFTEVSSVTTTVRHPNNPSRWFYADFQVGYDPCTCLYDSRLQLIFEPITSTQIEITNSDFPDLNIDLINSSGLNQASAIIPIAPRMITFHTMAENIE